MRIAAVFLSFAALSAHGIVLPVCEVAERAQKEVSTYPGRVVPIAQVDVTPQVSGEILEVCFANGAEVKEGDILYRLDRVRYESAVKNAESKVAECKAKAAYAELSHARHRKLLDTRAVSLDEVDNALAQRDSSRAALAAAEAELVAAKDDLKHCTVVAPISGRIGSTAKTKGNYVKSGGAPLVSIVQLAPIRVRFSVSNREILDVFGGDVASSRGAAEVAVTLANGTALAERGEIEYAENAADSYTDTMTLYSLFANESLSLVPGGTVAVTLSAKEGVTRPAVPATAVLQDTQGPYVWIVGADGAAERRAIARGDLDEGWVFVEKGLKVGERVVADGAHKVRRGMKVEAAK
jgi:RND family efflux transporter MFP subunit